MSLLPPPYLDAVVAIGFRDQSGKVNYAATGFVVGKLLALNKAKDQAQYLMFLVTNRHVFSGETTAYVRVNPEDGGAAREYDLDLRDKTSGKELWIAHQDQAIDVAIVPIAAAQLQQDKMQFSFFRLEEQSAGRAKAAELGVAEGDPLYVLGFPLGLVDERSYVVVRHGIMARVRDCIAGHKKEFLIDSSIFPGSSGSPVVMRPEVSALEGTKAVSGAYLVGIVSGYLPFHDVAVSQQTGRQRVVFEENSGLAVVFPMDYVEELVDKVSQYAGHVEVPKVPPPTATAVTSAGPPQK